jgi:hypothetical protein
LKELLKEIEGRIPIVRACAFLVVVIGRSVSSSSRTMMVMMVSHGRLNDRDHVDYYAFSTFVCAKTETNPSERSRKQSQEVNRAW